MTRNPKKITIYISNADAEIKCNQYALGASFEFSTHKEVRNAMKAIVLTMREYRAHHFSYDRIEKQKQKVETKTNL